MRDIVFLRCEAHEVVWSLIPTKTAGYDVMALAIAVKAPHPRALYQPVINMVVSHVVNTYSRD